MISDIQDAKDLAESLFSLSKKVKHFFEPFKPGLILQSINYRNNTCEMRLKLKVEESLRRRFAKIEIPYEQNLQIKDMFTNLGASVDHIKFHLDNEKWKLDPKKLPSVEEYLVILEGKVHPGFVKRLVDVAPSRNLDRTDDHDSYWLDARIADMRMFDDITNKISDVDVIVNVSLDHVIRAVLPSELANMLKSLKSLRDSIKHHYQSTPIRQMISSYSKMFDIIDRMDSNIYNLTTDPGIREYIHAQREIGPPFFIGETVNLSRYKIFSETIIVNTNTYLTKEEPHARGYLIFKKNDFIEDARKLLQPIIK